MRFFKQSTMTLSYKDLIKEKISVRYKNQELGKVKKIISHKQIDDKLIIDVNYDMSEITDIIEKYKLKNVSPLFNGDTLDFKSVYSISRLKVNVNIPIKYMIPTLKGSHMLESIYNISTMQSITGLRFTIPIINFTDRNVFSKYDALNDASINKIEMLNNNITVLVNMAKQRDYYIKVRTETHIYKEKPILNGVEFDYEDDNIYCIYKEIKHEKIKKHLKNLLDFYNINSIEQNENKITVDVTFRDDIVHPKIIEALEGYTQMINGKRENIYKYIIESERKNGNKSTYSKN